MTRIKNTTLKIFDDSVLLMPLGKLGGYEMKNFGSEKGFEATDKFLLTLALAYNDLKNIFLWWEMNREISPPIPPQGEVNKNYGQSCGIDNHIFRLMCGWLNEFCILLEKNASTISEPFFKDTIAKTEQRFADHWNSLCELSKADKTTLKGDAERIRLYLVKIRNHSTFHYYQTEPLFTGYTSHFSSGGPESKLAFATLATSLEQTRFFFGDAAATAMCSDLADGKFQELQELLSKYLRSAHMSIYAVIQKYMNKRHFAYRITE